MSSEAVAGGGGGGGEDGGGGISSGGSSPMNRMKFMCSYGGKIIPRPSDGHLKYIGGETRVIGVPRDIAFADLMKKLTSEFEADMVLKYQVIPEEFDVLVSVRNDEDLKHMLDEYDRHESGVATAKLRTFLFPSVPLMLDNQNGLTDHPHVMEQRYIDAINNTVRAFASSRPPPITANRPSFSLSASSSPKGNSPDDNMTHESTNTFMNSYHGSRFPMHKVHSSPSLYNLGGTPPHHQGGGGGSSHHYYPPHHQYHHQQHHHPHTFQSSSRPHHDPHRLSPSLPVGRPDLGRAPISPLNLCHSNVHNAGSPNVHGNWSSSGHSLGSGSSNKHDLSPFGCRPIERLDSHPPSPKNKLLE